MMAPVRIRALLSAIALSGLSSSCCYAQSATELIRSLRSAQDQLAQGQGSARALQQKLMQDVAALFAQMGTDDLHSQMSQNAALIFVMSGGAPDILKRMIAEGAPTTAQLKLLQGVLANAEGRSERARQLLGDIDARRLPQNLAGQFAFVQAGLVDKADARRQLALLDQARLLAAGGLVEEAALRREIFILAQQKDIGRFVTLSRQYVSRFGRSIYAGNFQGRFTGAIVDLALSRGWPGLAPVETMLAELVGDLQREVYLAVARAACVEGAMATALPAALRAEKISREGSPDLQRARLYHAAALSTGPQLDDAERLLQTVDARKLPKQDQELNEAVRAIVQEVKQQPVVDLAHEPDDVADGGRFKKTRELLAVGEGALSSAAAAMRRPLR